MSSVVEYIDLNSLLSDDLVAAKFAEPAGILIIRDGVSEVFGSILKDRNLLKNLNKEQFDLDPDTQVIMRGRVVTKRARHNLCFDDKAQDQDLSLGYGTVISFDSVTCLNSIRESLPEVFGPKASNLICELNLYYDPKKCGIGYHGDGERKKVICFRLGESFPLCYQWFYKHVPIGDRFKTVLNNGDIYIMSEKAVGKDWKRSSIPTLRHAAGADKYIVYKSPIKKSKDSKSKDES